MCGIDRFPGGAVDLRGRAHRCRLTQATEDGLFELHVVAVPLRLRLPADRGRLRALPAWGRETCCIALCECDAHTRDCASQRAFSSRSGATRGLMIITAKRSAFPHRHRCAHRAFSAPLRAPLSCSVCPSDRECHDPARQRLWPRRRDTAGLDPMRAHRLLSEDRELRRSPKCLGMDAGRVAPRGDLGHEESPVVHERHALPRLGHV